jgi:hypothetical protein
MVAILVLFPLGVSFAPLAWRRKGALFLAVGSFVVPFGLATVAHGFGIWTLYGAVGAAEMIVLSRRWYRLRPPQP